jgi:hypothetical protein
MQDPTDMLPDKTTVRDAMSDEMLKKQLPDVPYDKHLRLKDIWRFRKRCSVSIFHPTDCALWKGSISNLNNLDKDICVYFYFKKKKVALHRLLYANYIGSIDDNYYIRYTCENKGICFNVNHMKKVPYRRPATLVKQPVNKQTRRFLVVSSHVHDADWEKYKHKLVVHYYSPRL